MNTHEQIRDRLEIYFCLQQEHLYNFEKNNRVLIKGKEEFNNFIHNELVSISKQVIDLIDDEYFLKCSPDEWTNLMWLRDSCGLITKQDWKG